MKSSTNWCKNIACVLYMKLDQISKRQNGLFSPYVFYFEIYKSKINIFVVYGFLVKCRTILFQRKQKLLRAHTLQVNFCPNHYSGSSLNSKNVFGEIPIGLALYYCPLSRDIRIQNLSEHNFCLAI